MGSIPQYQREQFASTYVGGAQRDDSGAAIAGAVQEGVVEPARKSAIANLKAREDAATDLQANNAVIEYGLAVQKGLADLQKTYASDPNKYIDASQAFLQKEADSFSGSISDDRVKTKFNAAAATMKRAAITPAFEWVQRQQGTIATLSVESAARATALAASKARTIEEYKQNVAALDETDKLAEGIVDLKTREEIKAKAHKASIEAFIFNNIQNDPISAKKMLESGKLDKMPGFDAALKAEYISKAETKLRSDQRALQNDMRDNANRMSMRAIAGAVSVEEIEAAMESTDPGIRISTTDGKTILGALVRTVRTDAEDLANRDKEARSYLDMLEKFVDDNVDRAQFQQKVLQVYQDGHKDGQELVFLSQLKNDLNNIETVKKRQDVARAIDSAAATFKQLGINTEKKADFMKSLVFSIYAKNANPDTAMRRVAGQALVERLGITDTTVIDKEGLTFKDRNGKGITIYRSRVPNEDDVYYYKEVSP